MYLHHTKESISCPYCGDGKSKKKRAIILKGYNKGNVFKCLNCGVSVPESAYNKEMGIEDIYAVDDIEHMFKKRRTTLTEEDIARSLIKRVKSRKVLKEINYNPLPLTYEQQIIVKKHISPLDLMSELYLTEREIPKDKWHLFGMSYNFMDMYYDINKIDKKSKYPNKRLLIKFKDKNGDIIALKGRSFKKNDSVRYLTVYNRLDESSIERQPLFGLPQIDINKRVFILEGEFDSLFIDNAFALGSVHKWKIVKEFNIPKKNIVFLMDNDYDGKKASVRALLDGYKVFSWKLLSRKFNYDLGEIIDINKLFTSFDISREKFMEIIQSCVIESKLMMQLL